ncbi:spore coat U domain-containing protein [Psychrobacter sp.]|uniref:Csu type fimbrial protein n=1 Tax=Psychrobacter sp. TaxID=56811 RepID=UPI003BAFA0C4
MQFQKSLLTATLLAVISLTTIPANAETISGAFDVKLNIKKTCKVEAKKGTQDIDFGSYVAGTAGLTASSSAAIKVNCSKTTPYNIGLAGSGVMTDTVSTNTVAYSLLKTAGGTVWGNTATEVGGTGSGMATAQAKTHTVFAAVTGLTDDLTPGNYLDTVAVTVTY